MRLYETTVVFDSALKEGDIQEQKDRITNFISNNGGEIVKVDEWGKRRLAYEINKKQYGYYIHIRFNAPPSVIALLEQEYRLNEIILRYLTLLVDHRMLKKERTEERRLQQPDLQNNEESTASESIGGVDENAESESEPQAETT